MDQLVLNETVRREGPDFRGWHSHLALSPNREKTGWVWNVGGRDIQITPDIMVSKPRRVALVCGEYELNEFEHIGILRAAGLQHVRIWTPRKKTWPPYDGGSCALWNAVMPHVRKEGSLVPYRAPANITATVPNDAGRFVQYHGDGNDRDELRMTGVLKFPSLRKEKYLFGYRYPLDDLYPLACARTLGWPPALYTLSRLAGVCGWPHHARIVWPQETAPETLLEETGRHRFLDALAILNFAAPTGTYLTGAFHSVKGNHVSDLELVKKLAALRVVGIRSSAA